MINDYLLEWRDLIKKILPFHSSAPHLAHPFARYVILFHVAKKIVHSHQAPKYPK